MSDNFVNGLLLLRKISFLAFVKIRISDIDTFNEITTVE